MRGNGTARTRSRKRESDSLDGAGVVPDGIILNGFSQKRAKSGSYGYAYQEYSEEEDPEDSEIRLPQPAHEHF